MKAFYILLSFLMLAILFISGCGGGGGSNGNTGSTITVTLSPKISFIPVPGESVTFTAVVTGTTNTAVKWYVNNVLQSTTKNTFVFTPSAIGTYTIRVESEVDPSKFDSVTVTVGPPGPPG
jgi:ABC-type glycerol-3-phosphate transport system substrate-binding protein